MARTLTKEDIRGVFPPALSTFDDNEDLDLDTFRRELAYLRDLGATGFVIGGSTGEGHALTPAELHTLCQVAIDEVRGEIPIVGGVITTYTRDAIVRAQAARDAGADGIMLTPPIYQPPSDEGMVDYYDRVWREVGLPIVIYNVVPRAPVTPELTERLADIPGVIATKESIGGNLETLGRIIESVGDRIAVTWAQDPLMFPGYAMGAVGSISGINTILPEHSIRMFDAIQRNDLATAAAIHYQMTPVARAIGLVNWPAGVKAAVNLQGRKVGLARRPYVPLTPEQHSRLEQALDACRTVAG
ncbi:MAG TPA: dihydrodipicolinate synthase family protein [Micromonosporaceae bacterium]